MGIGSSNAPNSLSISIEIDGLRRNNQDQAVRIYKGGDKISGIIAISSPELKKIPNRQFRLVLASRISYYKDKAPNKGHLEKDIIFQKDFKVINIDDDEIVVFKRGKSFYRFSLQIPDNLPSPIFCQYGFPLVSHALFALLLKSQSVSNNNIITAEDNSKDALPLKASRIQYKAGVELQIQPAVSILTGDLTNRVGETVMETERNSVKLQATFRQTAYVPGQSIEIDIKIINKRLYNIKSLTISFVQEYRVHCTSCQRTLLERNVIGDNDHLNELQKKQKTFTTQCILPLPLTPLQPTHCCTMGLNDAGIQYKISTSYRVDIVVTFRRSILAPTLKLSKPIIIGNCPTLNQMAQLYLDISSRSIRSFSLIPVDEMIQFPCNPPQQHLQDQIPSHTTTCSPPSYNSIFIEKSATAPPFI